jgi:hypothetical protein
MIKTGTYWDLWYKKMDLGMEHHPLFNHYADLPFTFEAALELVGDLFKENTRLTNELREYKETQIPYVKKIPRGVGKSTDIGKNFRKEWMDIHGSETSWRFEYWNTDRVKVGVVDYDCTEEQDLAWAKNKLRMDLISNKNVSLLSVTYLGTGKHMRIQPITLED